MSAFIYKHIRDSFYDELSPVFSEMAESYTVDILRVAIEFIQSTFDPEEVFTVDQLTVWARENGFVEEE